MGMVISALLENILHQQFVYERDLFAVQLGIAGLGRIRDLIMNCLCFSEVSSPVRGH